MNPAGSDDVSDDDLAVSLEDVGVSLGGARILDGVSLGVRRGELLGVVGPNGAGKSTLLRAVNGVLPTDEGEVRVLGDDVDALSSRELARRVATLPQNTRVSFEYTVREVVEMGRHPRTPRLGGDPDPGAVERAMGATDTLEFAERSIDDVSGGERQRVLLARCLAAESPVLLLDEPTASLDVANVERMLRTVRGLVDRDDRTAVAAIHDLETAGRYCDRLVLLSDGAVLETGRPAEVLTSENLRRGFGVDAIVTGDEAPKVTPLGILDGRRGGERDSDRGGELSSDRGGELSSDRGGERGGERGLDVAPHVHVVGNGERLRSRLLELRARGYRLTTGALSEVDGALDVAEAVAEEVVRVQAHSGIDDDALCRVKSLASSADGVVIVPSVLPEGFVSNLRAASSGDLVCLDLPADADPEVVRYCEEVLCLRGSAAGRSTGGSSPAAHLPTRPGELGTQEASDGGGGRP